MGSCAAFFSSNQLSSFFLIFQIVFEAERGIGYTGDIALDEIRLKPGKCNQFRVPTQPPTTIKTTPLVTQGTWSVTIEMFWHATAKN